MDVLGRLPEACSEQVLTNLTSAADLASASQVCRSWYSLTHRDRIWHHLYRSHFPHSTLCEEPSSRSCDHSHPSALDNISNEDGRVTPGSGSRSKKKKHTAVSRRSASLPVAKVTSNKGLGPEGCTKSNTSRSCQVSPSSSPSSATTQASLQQGKDSKWQSCYRWKKSLDICWRSPPVKTFTAEGHHSWVNALRILPGCTSSPPRFLSGEANGDMVIWDGSGRRLHVCDNQHVVWCVDGISTWAAVGTMTGRIHIWDMVTGGLQCTLTGPDGNRPAAFHDNVACSVQCISEQQLLTGHYVQPACLWDIRCSSTNNTGSSSSSNVGDDRNGVASAKLCGTPVLQVQHTPGASSRGGRRGATDMFSSARLDDNTIVATDWDGHILTYDIRTGGQMSCVRAYPSGHHVFCGSTSRGRLATADLESTVKLWDIASLARKPAGTDYSNTSCTWSHSELVDKFTERAGQKRHRQHHKPAPASSCQPKPRFIPYGLMMMDDSCQADDASTSPDCALLGIADHAGGAFSVVLGHEWQMGTCGRDGSARVWDTTGVSTHRGPKSLHHPMAWYPSLDIPLGTDSSVPFSTNISDEDDTDDDDDHGDDDMDTDMDSDEGTDHGDEGGEDGPMMMQAGALARGLGDPGPNDVCGGTVPDGGESDHRHDNDDDDDNSHIEDSDREGDGPLDDAVDEHQQNAPSQATEGRLHANDDNIDDDTGDDGGSSSGSSLASDMSWSDSDVLEAAPTFRAVVMHCMDLMSEPYCAAGRDFMMAVAGRDALVRVYTADKSRR